MELAAQALFGRAELADLDESTLAAALQETEVADVSADATIVDLLVASGLESSKGAARRTVNEGGAYVNNVRIEDVEWVPGAGRYVARQLVGAKGQEALRGSEGTALARERRYNTSAGAKAQH